VVSTVSDESPPSWRCQWAYLWSLLGGKWTFQIIRLLLEGSRGFNEMQRGLPGITATVLSRRLTHLVEEGIVDRTVRETTPPTTRYSLTDTGRRLAVRLRAIERLDLRDAPASE
jgi:DNA-binding HxlR family transcriptional regulator